MKLPLFFLYILSCICSVIPVYGQVRVSVHEPQVPILLEREDNVLFYIRVDVEQSVSFNDITLSLQEEANKLSVKDLKLYYSGMAKLRASTDKNCRLNAPITAYSPENNRNANPSYSILLSKVKNPKAVVTLACEKMLEPGSHFFWVSGSMKASTKITATLQADIKAIRMNRDEQALTYLSKCDKRFMGVGVRHCGDDGVAAYRIPGLVTSNKGTLLAVYDVRHNGSVDLQEYIEIGLSRSTDGGQSWQKMQIPLSMGEYGGLPKAQNGVGDPAILVDKETGTIWIVALWIHGIDKGLAWWNSRQGMKETETGQVVMTKSEDDGKTWSKPMNITAQIKNPDWFLLLQGPGRGISMENGTLVFAGQYIGKDRVPSSCIIYSEDKGNSWQISNGARTNTTEAQVVELEPGQLMLNMRDNRKGSRAVATTKDMGKSWEEHSSSRKALIEPVCMASLISVAAKDNVMGEDLLIFSNPADVKDRKNMTIKISRDKGMTWNAHDVRLVDEDGNWGYSCLSMIDRETVGILYESSVAHIAFQAIALKDIMK